MQTILVVFHLFLAIGLIGLILIQHGKGADMGAAFGSGASGTVFGSKGSASFLTRLTAGLATLFFVTSMVLAYFATQRDAGNVVLEALQEPAVEVEAQPPQTDLPPMPAGTSDLPTLPAAGGDEATAPAVDIPAVAAPESADAQATAVEAPAEPIDTAPTDTAPAEPAQPPESKE